jgi:hypothetical protein
MGETFGMRRSEIIACYVNFLANDTDGSLAIEAEELKNALAVCRTKRSTHKLLQRSTTCCDCPLTVEPKELKSASRPSPAHVRARKRAHSLVLRIDSMG